MAYSPTEAVIGWLASMGYRASTTVPATRPASFVTAEPYSGAVESMVPSTSFAIQFWGSTDAECEDAALACRGAMLEGAKPDGIYNVAVIGGPYPFPDPDSRQCRWQLAVDITHAL